VDSDWLVELVSKLILFLCSFCFLSQSVVSFGASLLQLKNSILLPTLIVAFFVDESAEQLWQLKLCVIDFGAPSNVLSDRQLLQ